jgi:hypothetical protein
MRKSRKVWAGLSNLLEHNLTGALEGEARLARYSRVKGVLAPGVVMYLFCGLDSENKLGV